MIHKDCAENTAEIIHPMWLIEDKAIIFRSLIWLIAIIPLMKIDIKIIVAKNILLGLLFKIKIIGAIFCQVKRIKQLFQFKPSITSGNQKWNGAAPILVSSEEFITINIIWSIRGEINSLIKSRLVILNSRIREASAWVKKYLIDASVEYEFLVELIRGIIDNKLISNPNHIVIHEQDEIEIRVPRINEFINKIL